MNEKSPTPIERVEATGELTALRRHPNKVIRSEGFDVLRERYGDTFTCQELAALAARLYNELESTYGISVPAEIVVDTTREGTLVVAAAVDRISGVSLEVVEPTPAVVEHVTDLYASIARYLYEKSTSDDYYLTDLNAPSQYMYGTRASEDIPRIHLVDTDIYLSRGRDNLYLVVEWLARHMAGIERRFGTTFTEARKYLSMFAEETTRDEDVRVEGAEDNLRNIHAFLAGDKFGPVPDRGLPDFPGTER